MIKATLVTDIGPIALIGINDANVRRLRAGMPLDIKLKELNPPGMHVERVVISLAHTYTEVLEDWAKDGVPVTKEMWFEAQALDAQLKEEKTKQDENPF
jgi:hypothetical protein